MAEKAILAGMRFAADAGFDKSMREMKALAEAAGMEVADTFVQDGSAVNPGTYIGSGKIQEIRAAAEMEQADVILFNNTLTPMQMKNLVDALDREIIDRTALILRIFAERAGTREARLQVESANLQYMLPRLAGLHKELGRQGGAPWRTGGRGAGADDAAKTPQCLGYSAGGAGRLHERREIHDSQSDAGYVRHRGRQKGT